MKAWKVEIMGLLQLFDDIWNGIFRLVFNICLWLFIVLPIKLFLWAILGVSYFLMSLSKPCK